MSVINFVLDELSDNVLIESDESNSITSIYKNVPQEFGSPISQNRNGVDSFYHFDGTSSARNLSSSTEIVTDTTIYDAYGEEVSKTGTTVNPFGYKGAAGYYLNPLTEDLYVRERTYQPTSGRWLATDSLGFIDGTSLYRAYFVPNGIDPSGNQVEDIDLTSNCAQHCFELGEGNGWVVRDLLDCIKLCKQKQWCDTRSSCRDILVDLVVARNEWDGSRKKVAIDFEVTKGGDPKECCLVQIVRGSIRNNDGSGFAEVIMFGKTVDANFPDWVIDSVDIDPVAGSIGKRRWRYRRRRGERNIWSYTDRPNIGAGQTAIWDFKTCVFECDDIPKDGTSLNPKVLMQKAIRCVSWDFRARTK